MQKLLLLHGALGAASQFESLKEELSDSYNIHTINFEGHGGIQIPIDGYSIELFSGNVLKYLDGNGIETIDIFGYSMGGYVALYLAKFHPNRVGKIFTFATKFKWTPEIAEQEIRMLDPQKIEEKVPAFAKALYERHAPADWKQVMLQTALMMKKLGKNNALSYHDLKEINHKVQIGIGDKDKMVSLEETLCMHRNLPGSRFLVMPETPHPFEQISTKRLAYKIQNFFE